MVGIDRLGRNAAEVMTTIRDLGERGIVLRSLREGVDTSSASGRIAASVELELELGRERSAAARDARRARGQSIVAQRLSTTPRRRWRGGACQWRVREYDCLHPRRQSRPRLSGVERPARRLTDESDGSIAVP